MTGVVIYLEGGGSSADGRAGLREGMTEFLRELRDLRGPRGLRFRVIPCGSRQETFDAFRDGMAQEGTVATLHVLLVDSEDALAGSPAQHLQQRDHWNFGGIDPALAQLMVRTMETWLIADGDALAEWYRQGFHAGALPNRHDLEAVPKDQVARALQQATRNTTKGEYHKIRHASALLKRADPQRVRERCAHCERLFKTVRERVAGAAV